MSFWLSGPKRIKEGPAGGAAAAAYCVCLHLQERTIPPDSSTEPGRDAALVMSSVRDIVCLVQLVSVMIPPDSSSEPGRDADLMVCTVSVLFI